MKHFRENYRLIYSLCGAVIVPLFGRVALAGSGVEYDWFRYIIPLSVGICAGYIIGYFKTKWLQEYRELQQNSAYLKGILNNSDLIISLKDTEGRYLLVNKEFETRFNIIFDEVKGLTDGDIFSDTLVSYFKVQEKQVQCEKKLFHFNDEMSLNGNVYYFETIKFPIRNNDGNILGICSISLNVTDKKMMEEQLLNEQERLLVTLKSIGEGVIVTDIDGNVVTLNDASENLTGWTTEEAKGQPIEKVFNIKQRLSGISCENPVRAALKSKNIQSLPENCALYTRDGKVFDVGDSAAPIKNKQGNIIGSILVFRDLSEKKEMEKEVLRSRKLESISTLAGGIAHQYNNILVAILGNINLVSHLPGTGENVKRLLKKAEKATLRAKNLTMQLLTFTSGGAPVKKVCSLSEIIQDVSDSTFSETEVNCDLQIEDKLWDAELDRGQIEHVFSNLFSNSSQAMGGRGDVSVVCSNVYDYNKSEYPYLTEDKYIMIKVSDEGTGIPDTLINRIFDPFFTTKGEGNGLGLTIAHSIIQKHKGFIFVESEEGKGSQFIVYLPACGDKVIKKQNTEKISDTPSVILVMDDEEIVLESCHDMLEFFGYKVILTRNGEDAVSEYREKMNCVDAIDLLIMDLTIPNGMGGKDAIQEILKMDPKAKAIVSSGYSSDPVMSKCREYGFLLPLSKPFKMQELKETVEAALSYEDE